MSGVSAYTCTPRQIRKFIIRCMFAGVVPMVESSPGMGKSAIVASIAQEYGLELIDHRLSTSAPEDLSGLPKFRDNDTATFAPFDTFPVEGTPLPPILNEKGEIIGRKQGWLLFLDEFNSAKKEIQAAAYKLILDKMVGLRKLHRNVVIVCAGNLSTDRAIVNSIGTAMQSRLIWLTMALNEREFMEDVAFRSGWDSRIIAYLNYKKSALHDFRPDHNEKTFSCPRTWEFMNKLLQGQKYELTQHPDGTTTYTMEEEAPLFAGTITSGVALDFITFTKVFHKMPKLPDILEDPEKMFLPDDAATRYATITHLLEHVDNDNFEPIATYLSRMPAEIRVIFFRGLMIQKPKLKRHPACVKAMVSISRYLHDDDDVSSAA
jgi:hypothetical protein